MKHYLFGAGLAALAVLGQTTAQQSAGPLARDDYEGLVEPSISVSISSAVDGLIETTTVDRGDRIEKGQVLATLESSVERATRDIAKAQTEMRAALESSSTRLEFAERQLAKNQTLHEQGIISIEELDQFQTERDVASKAYLQAQENMRLAELDLQRAVAALDLRTIRSPLTGVVVERLLSAGALVSRSKESDIMRLAQLDPLYVEVIGPVTLLGKVQAGMEAEIRLEEPVGGTFRARVKVVDPVIDAASGTVGIRLELPNPDNALPAGLKCRVRFLP